MTFTWAEYKAAAEAAGLKDTDRIHYIEADTVTVEDGQDGRIIWLEYPERAPAVVEK
jgi:hypothetical protein